MKATIKQRVRVLTDGIEDDILKTIRVIERQGEDVDVSKLDYALELVRDFRDYFGANA